MRQVFLGLALCLAASLAEAQGNRGDDRPRPSSATALFDLLEQIPRDADGMIFLSDFAASRRQVDRLIPDADTENRVIASFSPMVFPPGYDGGLIFANLKAPEDPIGFSILNFNQMAGWGQAPATPVIATGIGGRHERIVARLEEHGLDKESDRYALPVWHVRDDFEIDITARSESPFGGALGMSQRFALDGNTLIFAQSWGSMDAILDRTATLMDDPETVSILETAYGFEDVGDLLGVVIIPGQPLAALDPARLLGLTASREAIDAMRERFEDLITREGLPPFGRYGVALWQNGRETTGALILPYTQKDIAELALGRFTEFFDTGTSFATMRPFDEVLPSDRRFEIASGTHAVVLAFSQTVAPEEEIRIVTFLDNPHRRLMQMIFTQDIDQLIGR